MPRSNSRETSHPQTGCQSFATPSLGAFPVAWDGTLWFGWVSDSYGKFDGYVKDFKFYHYAIDEV
jgi:hypothetical protein